MFSFQAPKLLLTFKTFIFPVTLLVFLSKGASYTWFNQNTGTLKHRHVGPLDLLGVDMSAGFPVFCVFLCNTRHLGAFSSIAGISWQGGWREAE